MNIQDNISLDDILYYMLLYRCPRRRVIRYTKVLRAVGSSNDLMKE